MICRSVTKRTFAKKMNYFLTSLVALISVINPLATVPIFVGLTGNKSQQQIRSIALRTSINMLVILLISFFAGNYILSFFGISLNALKITGGLIIASSGFALLTGSIMKHKGIKEEVKQDALTRQEVSLTPLAIPMLAGPGAISMLITYRQQYERLTDVMLLLSSVVLVSLITFVVLLVSRIIVKNLGESGINALSRIVGFIVIAIGIEFIISTIVALFDAVQ